MSSFHRVSIASRRLLLAACLVVAPAYSFGDSAQPSAAAVSTSKAADEMAEATNAFWASLTPEQQAKAGFEFADKERVNWHFVPLARKGLTFNDMDTAQQKLAHAMLSSGLSYHGYSEAVSIMSLDAVLKILEEGKASAPHRDPNNYFFSIFGKPGSKDPWGWRVEGHHLSLNFTIADGKTVVAGPTFYGSNPANVLQGPRKGLRVLAVEEDLGRALIKALDGDQRKAAVVTETAPKDILTFDHRTGMLKEPEGVSFAKLKPEQQKQLVGLVQDYAERLRGDLAADDLQRIAAAGWDKTSFAWAGGVEPGQPHYYRVQGPTFLIEYDCTQNEANHIHSVWRDLQNDFGDDLLANHYQETKHN